MKYTFLLIVRCFSPCTPSCLSDIFFLLLVEVPEGLPATLSAGHFPLHLLIVRSIILVVTIALTILALLLTLHSICFTGG